MDEHDLRSAPGFESEPRKRTGLRPLPRLLVAVWFLLAPLLLVAGSLLVTWAMLGTVLYAAYALERGQVCWLGVFLAPVALPLAWERLPQQRRALVLGLVLGFSLGLATTTLAQSLAAWLQAP